MGRLAGFVARILAQDCPHQTLEGILAAVGFLPVQFAQPVDDSFGLGPSSRGLEINCLAPATGSTADIFGWLVRHICWTRDGTRKLLCGGPPATTQ